MTPRPPRRRVLAAWWGRFHGAALAVLTALAIPVPTVAVALFLPSPASAAPPLSVQEQRWLHARVDGHLPPDPRTANPAQVAGFFARLPAGARRSLVQRYPQVVGNLDGVPLNLRYAANARAITGAGPDYTSWADPTRRFLAFDLHAAGRTAEVFGDLATATRIAVLVPGVGNSIHDFDRTSGPHQNRSPAVQGRALYDQALAQDPDARLAVIAWLGYQPPAALGRAAAREELARAGATALERFTAGLAAVRPDATISVVGHSYGSVVAGLAAGKLPGQVRDIVAIGSPGMGVDRAADLHTTAQVWAGCAPDDWIQDVPDGQVLGVGHGTAPVDPGFGAHIFAVSGARDHDQYLNPGTGSLRNIAWILLGSYGNVT